MISAPVAQANELVPATDASVRIMGRTARTDGTVTMAFPGIETVLRFSGSSFVKMSGEVLNGEGWFNVYIDGKALPKVQIPQGEYEVTLADNLDKNAEHTLRIVRRTEAWQGIVKLEKFTLETGAQKLSPAPLPQRKIMAIGDSITCGQNTEYTSAELAGNQSANAELAYGWCLAKDFDAQLNLVSYGGKGLLRDWQGLATEVTIPQLFERSLPDDPSSSWDHSAYTPDLILICVGQNDYNNAYIGAWDYAQAYVQFIDRVHALHPMAKIIIMSSPMAERSRTDGTQPRNAIHEVALSLVQQNYLKKGETFVTPIFMNQNNGTELDSHPIGPQQQAIADELKPIIKKLTGWNSK